MNEIRYRLKEIHSCMNHSDSITEAFCLFMAENVDDILLQKEFFEITCRAALYDIMAGVNGFSNKPIPKELPPCAAILIRIELPALIKAVFPQDCSN
jgi:hypothetical protein